MPSDIHSTAGNIVIDQPVDGVVYGHQPKPDQYVPKVDNILEAADIPTGPPGQLPYSLEWYAGAKDRKALREKLKDELLVRKDILRTDWVTMVCFEVDEAIQKVGRVRSEPEPFDLAILLARTIHERPREKKQANELLKYDRKVKTQRERCKHGLDAIYDRLHFNMAAIKEKERLDVVEEDRRKAEVEAERKKQEKLEKILARNAKRLAGEAVSEDEEEEDDEDESAEEHCEDNDQAEQVLSSEDEETKAALAKEKEKAREKEKEKEDDGLPAPNGRQGKFAELPPLQAGGSFGWKGPVAEVNRTVTPPARRTVTPPAPAELPRTSSTTRVRLATP